MAKSKTSKQQGNKSHSNEVRVRLDKWLWAARFYKTRQLANDAIAGGHVHLNGQRVKPSRDVQVNDQLEIHKTPFTFEVIVLGISARRGPAKEAQLLYQESEESIQKRELLSEQRKLNAAQFPQTQRRPDKRNRRRIIRFKNINQNN